MSDKLPAPKRGAFPTPKEVRDKASPYIPDPDTNDQHDDAKTRSPDRSQSQDDQSNIKDEHTRQK